MSRFPEEKLDELLRSRRIEPAREDLAERIIQRAQALPQQRPARFLDWLTALFDEFHLPKPAYVLASTLVAGVVIGLVTQAGIGQPSASHLVSAELAGQTPIESFLYPDEDLL